MLIYFYTLRGCRDERFRLYQWFRFRDSDAACQTGYNFRNNIFLHRIVKDWKSLPSCVVTLIRSQALESFCNAILELQKYLTWLFLLLLLCFYTRCFPLIALDWRTPSCNLLLCTWTFFRKINKQANTNMSFNYWVISVSIIYPHVSHFTNYISFLLLKMCH